MLYACANEHGIIKLGYKRIGIPFLLRKKALYMDCVDNRLPELLQQALSY